MHVSTFKIWGLLLAMFCASLHAQSISESFELRYFSNDEKANGETDFKGETAVFDTETRVEFLKHYADYAKHFFNDPQLDKLVVTDQEVDFVFRKIKPQPQPEVRKRVRLNQWKWTAWRPGLIDDERRNMRSWISDASADIRDGALIFKRDAKFTKSISEQGWRFFIEWKMKLSEAQNASFLLLNVDKKPVVRVGLNEAQQFFYQTKTGEVEFGKYEPDAWISCKIEVDLENGKYNFYVNEQLQADFVDLVQAAAVHYFKFESSKSNLLDDVCGVGYQKSNITDDIHWRDVPFTIDTFLDEDFELHPGIENWASVSYDDAHWETTDLPKAHGGERYAGETLYLRKWVDVQEFERAVFNIETLDPGGEIWINKAVVHVTQNRHPISLDISKYLTPNARNLICLKVFPNKVEQTNRHTSADEHTGWFAGRAYLDFTAKRYIEDVFVYTRNIDDSARLNCEIRLKNIDWQMKEREIKQTREFHGQVTIKAFKWFPDERNTPLVVQTYPVYLRLFRNVTIEEEITVPQPELWTPEQPNLYKIVVELADASGRKIDDYVLTTGIRTISQEGGTFRLNGKPSMMNGALLFSYKSPLEDIARLIRCSPDDWIVKELLMIKKMNANTIRMSVHHGMKGGINDPHYAEIGDQLGVMFQWTTGTWIRTGSPWLIDFEGLPKYVKQVRNHPSIVMWQPANHPKFVDFDEAMDWFEKIYDSIYPRDPSRLISPTANISRMDPRNDDGTLNSEGNRVEPIPIWTAPMITRGSMEHGTGYGAEWSTLRLFPSPPEWAGEDGWRERGFRMDYLKSDDRAWFDFESEESIGQPNWNLRKGKPSYQFKSYELRYDVGSIGRMLTVDEWQESQAWQAFSGYEAYKKKRWLDYDGLAWCCLRGGGNTSTYQKPLIDYYDHAKLSYYALKMVFQKTLAGSGNVDVVYGPDDAIEPVIMHLGDEQKVDLSITLLDLNRNEVDRVKIDNIELQTGRSVKELASVRFENVMDGFYVIRYEITAAE